MASEQFRQTFVKILTIIITESQCLSLPLWIYESHTCPLTFYVVFYFVWISFYYITLFSLWEYSIRKYYRRIPMLLSSLLFGVSASLDALLVGISYGIRQIRIRFWQNLVISLITLLGTCLSVGLGHQLIPFLPTAIQGCAGSLILILLGLYYIAKWAISFIQTHKITNSREITSTSVPEDPTEAATAYGRESASASADLPQLKLAEVFTLSLTLSLNNLSAGLSASLAGLTLLPAAISTLACSILFLFFGNRLGQSPILQLAGKAADPLSGILLIGLGVIQFFL